MAHPLIALQARLVAALLADTDLMTALGSPAIFDAPPKDQQPPYVVIARHDILPRDGDAAPGNDHRLLLQCWHPSASRKTVVAIAERVTRVALDIDLSGPDLTVSHAQHDRTDTAIDPQSGHAHAAIALRFLSESIL